MPSSLQAAKAYAFASFARGVLTFRLRGLFRLRFDWLRDAKYGTTADSNLTVGQPTLTHLLRLEATLAATAALSLCACHNCYSFMSLDGWCELVALGDHRLGCCIGNGHAWLL